MRDRLIEIFKNTNYKPFEQCVTEANLANQFTEYALNCIVNNFIANGVIVPPCKVGDTVYKVVRDKRVKKPYECEVVGFWYSKDENCNNVHLVRYVKGEFDSSFSVPLMEFGKTVFLTREEAEAKLKGEQ